MYTLESSHILPRHTCMYTRDIYSKKHYAVVYSDVRLFLCRICVVQDKLLNSILPKQYAEKVRKKEMYQGAFRSLHIERFEDVRLVAVIFLLLHSLYCAYKHCNTSYSLMVVTFGGLLVNVLTACWDIFRNLMS